MNKNDLIIKLNNLQKNHINKLSVYKINVKKKNKGSIGEQLTRNFLQQHNIIFTEQKTFNDLKDKDFLRYDFYIFYKNKNMLLECDGLQHNKPVDFSGHLSDDEVQANFEKNKYHDKLKNEYAKNHNIPLYRISWNGNKKQYLNELRKLFLSMIEV